MVDSVTVGVYKRNFLILTLPNFIRYSYASDRGEVMSKQMSVSNNEKLASREIQIVSHCDSL